MNDFKFEQPHLRSSWNETRMLIRGRLTDRKIEQYRRAGWYSDAFREARREMLAKKAAKRSVRDGSFIKDGDRLIYNPL